jgi:hypothetical protein
MEATKVDEIGQAAIAAANAAMGSDSCAVIVIVRPLRAGETMNVTTNIVNDYEATARFMRDGIVLVERKGAGQLATTRRLVVPS